MTGNELKLDNMTPGDKVNFNIKVENKSSVTVKYRTRIYCGEDNGLYAGLKYSITNGTETYESMAITDWATLTPDVKEVANLDCKVELPVDAGNEYKNKSCNRERYQILHSCAVQRFNRNPRGCKERVSQYRRGIS